MPPQISPPLALTGGWRDPDEMTRIRQQGQQQAREQIAEQDRLRQAQQLSQQGAPGEQAPRGPEGLRALLRSIAPPARTPQVSLRQQARPAPGPRSDVQPLPLPPPPERTGIFMAPASQKAEVTLPSGETETGYVDPELAEEEGLIERILRGIFGDGQ
jgi:hypothetical protein